MSPPNRHAAVFGPFDGDFDPFDDEEDPGPPITFGRGNFPRPPRSRDVVRSL